MVPDVGGTVSTTKAVVRGVQRQNVTFMAASIAYQAFISLLPLLVLLFFLVSIVGDEGLAASVSESTETVLPETGRELLESSIEGSVATAGTSAIGLVTLVWGSLKIFRGLDTAFSEIYATTADNSLVDQLEDGLVVLVALVVALLAMVVATTVFSYFPHSELVGILNPLLLVVGLTVAFLPMYYRFPDVDASVRDVLPGAVIAAVGWAALQALFQVYVSFAASSDSAGALGAVLLLLTWLYFGGLVLLVGAVVNATVADRLPREDAVEDDEESREPFGSDEPSIHEPLEERHADLQREYGLLRNDLRAQRERRYRLEDRTDRLAEENARLEAENERLRRQVELHRETGWQRALRWVADHTDAVNVGVVKRE